MQLHGVVYDVDLNEAMKMETISKNGMYLRNKTTHE